MDASACAATATPAAEPKPRYTSAEERANAATHGAGVLLSVAALVVMVTQASLHGDAWRVVGAAVFGLSLILLYGASTLYHAARDPARKDLFHRVDHAAIFVLIAGSYTPFTIVTLRGPWGWTLFGLVWGMALAGIVFRVLFIKRFIALTVALYLIMGWLVVIAFKPLLASMPPEGVRWLFAGGLCYSGGVTFYAWKRLPYHHAIWHLFVMAGSYCHFIVVLNHL